MICNKVNSVLEMSCEFNILQLLMKVFLLSKPGLVKFMTAKFYEKLCNCTMMTLSVALSLVLNVLI